MYAPYTTGNCSNDHTAKNLQILEKAHQLNLQNRINDGSSLWSVICFGTRVVDHLFTSQGCPCWKNRCLCAELGQELHGSSRWRYYRGFWRVLHSGDQQDVPWWAQLNHGCVSWNEHFHSVCACFLFKPLLPAVKLQHWKGEFLHAEAASTDNSLNFLKNVCSTTQIQILHVCFHGQGFKISRSVYTGSMLAEVVTLDRGSCWVQIIRRLSVCLARAGLKVVVLSRSSISVTFARRPHHPPHPGSQRL